MTNLQSGNQKLNIVITASCCWVENGKVYLSWSHF